MSLLEQRVPITTQSDGTDLSTVRAGGCRLLGVMVELGTLSTPDIAITDEPSGTALLTLAALAASGTYQPMVAGADPADGSALAGAFASPVVFGRIQVATSGAGDATTGEVTLLLER